MKPKNSYRWVPMISGHGTEKLFSMGFEILGLAIGPYCARTKSLKAADKDGDAIYVRAASAQ